MMGRVWATISARSASTNTTQKGDPFKHDSGPFNTKEAHPNTSLPSPRTWPAHESCIYILQNPNPHPHSPTPQPPSPRSPAGRNLLCRLWGAASSLRPSSGEHGLARATGPPWRPRSAPSAGDPPVCGPLGAAGRRPCAAAGRGQAANSPTRHPPPGAVGAQPWGSLAENYFFVICVCDLVFDEFVDSFDLLLFLLSPWVASSLQVLVLPLARRASRVGRAVMPAQHN
jgi:hypothetical protein